MGKINLTREEAESSAATASRLEAVEHDRDMRFTMISPDTCPRCYHARMDKLRTAYAQTPLSDAAMEMIVSRTFCEFHR